MIDKIVRNVLTDKPRIFKYDINWYISGNKLSPLASEGEGIMT